MTKMRRTFAKLDHVGDELIAVSRHGQNELMLTGMLLERLAERRDVTGQGVFFDGRFRPDELEQLVLIDHALPMLDEGGEDLESLGGERNERLIPPEQTASSIDNVGTESIPAPVGLRAV